MFDRPPSLLPGVVLALRSTLAARQVGVVPGHLAHHRLGHLGCDRARGELVDGVAHLGDLAEHHGGAGAHQQVGGEAHRRVGGDAGERIAAAALHAHHQLGGRTPSRAGARSAARGARAPGAGWSRSSTSKPTCASSCRQTTSSAGCAAGACADREAARRQQPLGLQLLAAQADHHHLAAEVRVQADVAQRADRDHRVGRVDRHAAAVAVLQPHHVVDVRDTAAAVRCGCA